jgi:hypothetical protein
MSAANTPMAAWPTLAAFHAAKSARASSREVVFGSEWYTARERPPWRASWIQATGEFIVVQLAGGAEAEHGSVELLATTGTIAPLELGLRGWWHVCGWAGSLPWLRARLQELHEP